MNIFGKIGGAIKHASAVLFDLDTDTYTSERTRHFQQMENYKREIDSLRAKHIEALKTGVPFSEEFIWQKIRSLELSRTMQHAIWAGLNVLQQCAAVDDNLELEYESIKKSVKG